MFGKSESLFYVSSIQDPLFANSRHRFYFQGLSGVFDLGQEYLDKFSFVNDWRPSCRFSRKVQDCRLALKQACNNIATFIRFAKREVFRFGCWMILWKNVHSKSVGKWELIKRAKRALFMHQKWLKIFSRIKCVNSFKQIHTSSS